MTGHTKPIPASLAALCFLLSLALSAQPLLAAVPTFCCRHSDAPVENTLQAASENQVSAASKTHQSAAHRCCQPAHDEPSTPIDRSGETEPADQSPDDQPPCDCPANCCAKASAPAAVVPAAAAGHDRPAPQPAPLFTAAPAPSPPASNLKRPPRASDRS